MKLGLSVDRVGLPTVPSQLGWWDIFKNQFGWFSTGSSADDPRVFALLFYFCMTFLGSFFVG